MLGNSYYVNLAIRDALPLGRNRYVSSSAPAVLTSAGARGDRFHEGYLETITEGYLKWDLPQIALDFAVASTRNRLLDLGIREFEPDGPKRMRPA